jgi:WD40 repeat protein
MQDASAIEQHKVIELLTSWATDLVNVVGKFGSYLTKDPDTIYKLIPPFCPENSAIYRQFGWMEMQVLCVSGTSATETWDECLACFSFGPDDDAGTILATGNHIAIVVNTSLSSHIHLYSSITFKEERQLIHPEWVYEIRAGQIGEHLITYGRKAIKVWKISTGECIKTINNESNNPMPQALLFHDQRNRILVLGKDRCIISVSINDGDSAEWKINPSIIDRSPDDTKLKEPICSAFSPDGNMIAFGYSGHLVTVWETQNQKVVSKLSMKFHKENMTIPKYIDGEVDNLLWHPSSGEIIGLQRDGLLFKWDPYDDESIMKVRVEQAYRLAISPDGSRLATGDAEHVIKIFATADLPLLHSLSTQGSIRSLSFSTNSRRVYDVRGGYGNAWEPSSLVDPTSAVGSLSHKEEYQFSRAQNITTVYGESMAPIYCYGTENGPAMLREIGSRAVWELENGSDAVPIHKLTLSDNGSLAAIADMSGRVSMKVISKDDMESGDLQIHHDFVINIGRSTGVISRLLFHPGGSQLFVDTTRAIYTINITTHAVVSSKLVRRMMKTQWICHPTNPDYTLGFSDTLVYVLNWDNLEDVEMFEYFPPRPELHPKLSSYKLVHSHENNSKASEEQQVPNSNTKGPDILLEILHHDPFKQLEQVYLGFSVADIKVGSDREGSLLGDTHAPSNKLSYTILPQDVTSRIRELLALLSHGRIVFLDTEQWICTWAVSSAVTKPSQAHSDSKRGLPESLVTTRKKLTETSKSIISSLQIGLLQATAKQAPSCAMGLCSVQYGAIYQRCNVHGFEHTFRHDVTQNIRGCLSPPYADGKR